MIVPNIKEIKSIHTTFINQEKLTSPIQILHKETYYNKIQSNINSNSFNQEFNNQNQEQKRTPKKIIFTKTNSIKYHSFSNNNTKQNRSTNLSFSLSSIINQSNTNEIKLDNQNNFYYNYNNISTFKYNNHHIKFSKEEDNLLIRLVNEYGAKNWKHISSLMPGRSSKQCRDRYANYLAPEINHSKWEEKDDQLLYEKYILYGPKWSQITQFFPNRTANAIKNRYKYTVCRKINLIKSAYPNDNKKTMGQSGN